MLITPHALTGAALAVSCRSLWLALPLALASHFILDAIPSWDVGLATARDRTLLTLDGLVAVAALGLLLSKTAPAAGIRIGAGAMAALLPDLAQQGLMIGGIALSFFPLDLHQAIQSPARWWLSLPVQLLLSLGLFLCLYNKLKGSRAT